MSNAQERKRHLTALRELLDDRVLAHGGTPIASFKRRRPAIEWAIGELEAVKISKVRHKRI